MSRSKMLSYLCFLLVNVMVNAESYKCQNAYEPSKYIDELRVPPHCEHTTPSYKCPASWKTGVPRGTQTSLPLIYSVFISCHEGFFTCGYVPINSKTGDVLGQSGVTVGAGVDLGAISDTTPFLKNLSNAIVTEIGPYFGLKKSDAACAAIERPLQLSTNQTEEVTEVVKKYYANEVLKKYNAERNQNTSLFENLARGIRTAIVSVWYQFGPPDAYPTFWGHVKGNDWKEAVKELRHFYKDESKQLRGDLKRRNDEADIIEATFLECQRSIDAVFLVDESGSVSSSDFQKALEFVKDIIKAFPDEKLKGDNGTRFGLARFGSLYTDQFYLNSYTTQTDYLAAIDRVGKSGGGTRLGSALNNILTYQFIKSKGLRDNLPEVLIVLTDGKSGDDVSIPAKNVRNQDIAIYAIGIGNYDLFQLQEVVTPPYVDTHVYTLANFSELETLIATITAASCYEPKRVSLNNTTTATATKDEYQYFAYVIDITVNLKLRLQDVLGGTSAYGSRSNPHPNKYDHDISFENSDQKLKIIVISAVGDRNTRGKRDIANNTEQAIYFSVQATTDLASFTIVGNTCDPSNCTEGTNEIPITKPPTTAATTTTTTKETTTTTTTKETTTTAAGNAIGKQISWCIVIVTCFMFLYFLFTN